MAESEIEIQMFSGIVCSRWEKEEWNDTYNVLLGMYFVAFGTLSNELNFLCDIAMKHKLCATN